MTAAAAPPPAGRPGRVLRFPLRARVFLFGVLLALVPLGLVGSNLIRITRDELKSAANEELTGVAAQLAADLDAAFRGRLLAPLLVIRNGVDSPELDVRQKIALLTQGLADLPDVKALQLTVLGAPRPVLVTDPGFAERLAAGGIDAAAALQTPGEVLMQMLRADDALRPAVWRLEGTGDWLATLALPLATPISGRPVTLSAQIDLAPLAALARSHPFAQRGEISVVDAAGRTRLAAAEADLTDRTLVEAARALIGTQARAVALQPYSRADGTAMLGAYAFPESFPWAVVAELSEATAYGVVDQMTRAVLLVAAFGVVAAGAGALLFAQGLTRPILRLGEAANRVGRGDLAVRLPVRRARDELGDLALRFNAMIGELSERMELMKFVSDGTVAAIRRAEGAGIARGGVRRDLTVLFSDIRGYTAFSESVAPEVVVEMLNLYLDTQTVLVRAAGGDVDKFIGDALVAVFDGADREARAVGCGLDIQAAMRGLLAGHPEWNLGLGIGISAGEVVLGAMGARDRMDFTVLGSTVNLAARLCARAPAGAVLVNAAVAKAAAGRAVFDALEPVALKGYAAPVPAFAARRADAVAAG
jgi:adenylate cyclase